MQSRSIKRRVYVALGWNDPRLILAIGHYAREAGWHLETRQFFTETIPPSWRGDGLIVSNSQRPELLKFIRKQAPLQPTVLIGGNQPGIRAPQVVEDDAGAGRLAAKHFLDQGHKNFAWYGPIFGMIEKYRHEGFHTALRGAGFDCHILTSLKPRKLLAELRSLPRPLACYVLDDQIASDLIETCLNDGLRVPQDVAIMGTGNIGIACECAHVPISSIDLDEEEIGRRAAMLLDDLMRGGKAPRNSVVVPSRGLVVRKSTDFLAVTDPALTKAVDFISGNFESSPSLDQIAARAGVSRRTLYNLFRRDLRRTPTEFIDQLRFLRAQRLLAAEKLTIAETARRCGFGSVRTLSRIFIEREGVTAQAWRRLRQARRLAALGE